MSSSTLQRNNNKEKREYTERIFCPVCSTPNRAFMDSDIEHFPKYQHNIKRPLLEAMIRQAHFVENRPYGRNSFCPYCNIHYRVDMTAAADSVTQYLEAKYASSNNNNNNNNKNTRRGEDILRDMIFENFLADTHEHSRNYPYDSISRGPANPIAVRNASIAKTKTGELHLFCPACSGGNNTTVSLRSGSLVVSMASGKQNHEILDLKCEQCGTFELRRTDTLTGSWRDVEFTPKESHAYF